MRVWVYGDTGGSGGYIRYCKGLFATGSIPVDMNVRFVCSAAFYEQIKPLDPIVQVVTHPWPASPSRVQRYLWHLLLYPKLRRDFAPDIEFYPSGQLRVYLRKSTSVATCHNLLLYDHEELRRLKGTPDYGFFAAYRARQAGSLVQASGVIFPSEHTHQIVMQELPGIRRQAVVPHGLDPVFLLTEPRSYALGSPVNVLYVSSVFPYKHHVEVIRAMRAVRQRTALDVRLRLIGSANPAARRQLEDRILGEGAQSYVDMIGEVTSDALRREYRRADLFVFASSSESFGITLLEAMGARLPIACASRTGLPDILRDAGTYFDPEDAAAIAAAIMRLLGSEEQRRVVGERAYQYARSYTWERCARQTFDFIRRVHEDAVGES